MLRVTVFCGALLLTIGSASAGAREDCDQEKDQDRSIRGCSTLIKNNSRDTVAYYNRGLAYERKDRAIADCNRAIEIDPKYAIAYSNRGSTYRSKGEYDRSIADLTRAIELDPNDLAIFAERAQTYEARGERDKAIEDYNRALTLPAHDAEAKKQVLETSKRLATGTPGPRIALLIGNQRYSDKVGPLRNPLTDVALVETALKKVGFEVTVRRAPTRVHTSPRR